MALVQPTDFENMMLYSNYNLRGGCFDTPRKIRHLMLPGPFLPIKVLFNSKIKLLRKTKIRG